MPFLWSSCLLWWIQNFGEGKHKIQGSFNSEQRENSSDQIVAVSNYKFNQNSSTKKSVEIIFYQNISQQFDW